MKNEEMETTDNTDCKDYHGYESVPIRIIRVICG